MSWPSWKSSPFRTRVCNSPVAIIGACEYIFSESIGILGDAFVFSDFVVDYQYVFVLIGRWNPHGCKRKKLSSSVGKAFWGCPMSYIASRAVVGDHLPGLHCCDICYRLYVHQIFPRSCYGQVLSEPADPHCRRFPWANRFQFSFGAVPCVLIPWPYAGSEVLQVRFDDCLNCSSVVGMVGFLVSVGYHLCLLNSFLFLSRSLGYFGVLGLICLNHIQTAATKYFCLSLQNSQRNTLSMMNGSCDLYPPIFLSHYSQSISRCFLPTLNCKVVPIYSLYWYPQVYLYHACRLRGDECCGQWSTLNMSSLTIDAPRLIQAASHSLST